MNVDRCLGFLYLAPYLNPRFRRCAYACCVIVFSLNFMKVKPLLCASEDEGTMCPTRWEPHPNSSVCKIFSLLQEAVVHPIVLNCSIFKLIYTVSLNKPF